MTSTEPRTIAGEPLIVETTRRIFTQHCDPTVVRDFERGVWPDTLWDAITTSGLHLVGSDPDGSRGSLVDAAEILFQCGAFAAPVPIAESGILGGWLATLAGLEAHPTAPLTVPIPHREDHRHLESAEAGWTYRSYYARVPWAEHAEMLLDVVATPDGREHIVAVPLTVAEIKPAKGLSGESRASVTIAAASPELCVALVPAGTARNLRLRASLSRALMTAGALHRCADIAQVHARIREQFGRPLHTFQAIQHHLVLAAQEAAVAMVAVFIAAAGLDVDPSDQRQRVAIARTLTDRGGFIGTESAHQILGAIGTTFEHDLNLFSRRIWAWNDEWSSGDDPEAVGTSVLTLGPTDLWEVVVAASAPYQDLATAQRP